MKKPLYFDYAAATPLDPAVLEVMVGYFSKDYFNPSSLYTPARQVKRAVYEARLRIAKVLGVKPFEIIFTAGATESINLALFGIKQLFPKGSVVVSSVEHSAVINTAQTLFGNNCLVAPVKPNGRVDLDRFKKLINDKTVLLSIQYANNEVGIIQPIHKISQLITDILDKRLKEGNKLPLYLHSDASQAANYLDLHVRRLGVDLLTLNSGKIYGPKQMGCLYVKSGIKLSPLIIGGGQEQGLRSGTENVPAIIGFTKALEIVQQKRDKEDKRLRGIKENAIKRILTIPGSTFNGVLEHSLPNIMNFTFDRVNGETLVHYLDNRGVLSATGAACSAASEDPSHVLLAMGLSKAEANCSLRLSMGRYTIKEEVDKLVKWLAQAVNQIRQL